MKLFIAISMLLLGCSVPKMKNYAEKWIDTDISRLQAVKNRGGSGSEYVNWWRDNKINKNYTLSNGNLVYVSPERKGCIIHWEIDKSSNRIIGYKFEGNKCY